MLPKYQQFISMSWLCDSKCKEFSFLMYIITISNYQIYMELEWLKLHAIMSCHGKSNPRNPGSNRGPTQKFVSQPSKRLRPYSDSDVSQNLSQNLQELSDLLDNLSKNEELVEQAASLNLNKPALRNTILNI